MSSSSGSSPLNSSFGAAVAPCCCVENCMESRESWCGVCHLRREEEDPALEGDVDKLWPSRREQKQDGVALATALDAVECPVDNDGHFGGPTGCDGEDFGTLGPPPSCCPVLCRQKATDFTAAREGKRAGFFDRASRPSAGLPVQASLWSSVNRVVNIPRGRMTAAVVVFTALYRIHHRKWVVDFDKEVEKHEREERHMPCRAATQRSDA
ncbi:hypothetical protein BBJ28_00023135 [Nothophytophthora sp. Chile5]|nr:hypothetical protein BBJ28_00023135 [Nothophytophthora sp. Chile5]